MAMTTTLRAYLDDVDVMLRAGSTTKVISHCRHILQHYPQNVGAYRLLARALLDRGEREGMPEYLDEALEVFQRVLSVLPADFEAHWGLGLVNLRKDRIPQALWHFERAYEQQPGNVEVQQTLRDLYARWSERQDSGHLQMTRAMLARQYLSAQLFDQALIELRVALNEAPDRVDLQLLLAQTLWETQRDRQAAEQATKVLARLPYCLEANAILARFWLSHQRPSDAQVFLDRIEVIDPYVAAQVLKPRGDIVDRFTLPRLDYDLQSQAAALSETPEWMRDLEVSGAVPRAPEPIAGPQALFPSEPSEWDARIAEAAFAPLGETGAAPAAQEPFVGLEADWLKAEAEQGQLPDWLADLPGAPGVAQPLAEEKTEPWPGEQAALPDLGMLFAEPEPLQGEVSVSSGAEWLAVDAAQEIAGVGQWAADAFGWNEPAEPEPNAAAGQTSESGALPADWLADIVPETMLPPEGAADPFGAGQPTGLTDLLASFMGDQGDVTRGEAPPAVPSAEEDWLSGTFRDELPPASTRSGPPNPYPLASESDSGPEDVERSDSPFDGAPVSGSLEASEQMTGASDEGTSAEQSLEAPWFHAEARPDDYADGMTHAEYDVFAAALEADVPSSVLAFDQGLDPGAWAELSAQVMAPVWSSAGDNADTSEQAEQGQIEPDSAANGWVSVGTEADEPGLEDMPMTADSPENFDLEPLEASEPQQVPENAGGDEEEVLRALEQAWAAEPDLPTEEFAFPAPASEAWPAGAGGVQEQGLFSAEEDLLAAVPELGDMLAEPGMIEDWRLFEEPAGQGAELAPGADADLGWLQAAAHSADDDWLAALSAGEAEQEPLTTGVPELMEPEVSIEEILAAAVPDVPVDEPISGAMWEEATLRDEGESGLVTVDEMLERAGSFAEMLPEQLPEEMAVAAEELLPADEFTARELAAQETGLAALLAEESALELQEVSLEEEALALALDFQGLEELPLAGETWETAAELQAEVGAVFTPDETAEELAPADFLASVEGPVEYASAGVTGILQPDEAPDWMMAFTGEELPEEALVEPPAEPPVTSVFEEPQEEAAIAEVLDGIAYEAEEVEALEFGEGGGEDELLDEDESEGAMPEWLLAITQSEADKLDLGLFEEPESYAHGDVTGVLQPDQEPDWLTAVQAEAAGEALAPEMTPAATLADEGRGALPELEATAISPEGALGVAEEVLTFLDEEVAEVPLDIAEFRPSEMAIDFEVDDSEVPVLEGGLAEAEVLPHTKADEGVPADDLDTDDFALDDVVPLWLRRSSAHSGTAGQSAESWAGTASQGSDWLRSVFEQDEGSELDG